MCTRLVYIIRGLVFVGIVIYLDSNNRYSVAKRLEGVLRDRQPRQSGKPRIRRIVQQILRRSDRPEQTAGSTTGRDWDRGRENGRAQSSHKSGRIGSMTLKQFRKNSLVNIALSFCYMYKMRSHLMLLQFVKRVVILKQIFFEFVPVHSSENAGDHQQVSSAESGVRSLLSPVGCANLHLWKLG